MNYAMLLVLMVPSRKKSPNFKRKAVLFILYYYYFPQIDLLLSVARSREALIVALFAC